MKKFLLLLLVSLILTSCYTNGDCTTAVKEAYPDNEIYQIKINEFILVDSIGIWYVNANMGVKEPYTEKQLVKLWSKKSIKKLQQVATMNSRNSNVIRSLEKQKHDNTQRLNTPISLTAPSTTILQKRVAKVIKKTTDVNRSMNAYKTRKRSFARPNRREPENIDRSGVVISTKYRPDIHIYQDTSGSISEENYEAATRMLIDIAIRLDVDLYYTSFSHIISRPTKVRVKGRSKEAIYNSIKKIPKVGGGTDFKNVWDIINQNPQRQKQIGFIISDMEYWAPTVETKIPTNLYYLPIANISWQAIQRMTRNFLDSTKHYKQNIRRNILY